MTKFAIIRIRGPVRSNPKIRYTLTLLGLKKPNNCTLRDVTPALLGMLRIAQPYITWGEANEETIKLFEKKQTCALCPPRGGYGRKGVKLPFAKGGAYGSRKEKINDLVKRMLYGCSKT